MLITLMLALTAIIGYLMGSVNGSIIISRFLYGGDIRSSGSGNAGLTNFYRTYGLTGAAGVIAIDVLKGVLGAFIGGLLLSLAAPDGFEAEFTSVGQMTATFCVILGHVFPIFYGILSTISVPITLLANGFSGLCLTLACLSVAMIVIKHAGNISRLIHHKEPKIVFKKDLSHKLDNDSF